MNFYPTPAPEPAFRITPQLVIGLLIVFVGVVFTLDELGIAPAASYLRYWPSALIALGVAKLLQARDGGGALTGLLLTGVGIWLQGEELNLFRVNIRQVWPLALVLFGGYLVWQGLAKRSAVPVPPPLPDLDPLPPFDSSPGSSAWDVPVEMPAEAPAEPPVAAPAPARKRSASCGAGPARVNDDNGRMNVVAIMAGVNRGNNSPRFRGADLVAVMGGCEIDLRKAAINGDAVIDLFCMWGGIEIRVPEDWTVVSHVVPLMGGVDDRTRPPQAATAHRLTLRGVALMGGIEIKN
jgi:hypothetical protein